MKTAIVFTDAWYNIIATLQAEGWKVIAAYDGFDKGIDFDSATLQKDNEQIEFTWDNWMEGEIKCSDGLMAALQTRFSVEFSSRPPSGPTEPPSDSPLQK